MRILSICFVLLASAGWAQIGGKKSFEFLNVPNNARLAALGGVNVSLRDRDVNFFSSNPALVGDTLAGFASATYQAFVANTSHAFVSYSHKIPSVGALNFGVQHLNYGVIEGFDASGSETGEFKSGETALIMGASNRIGNFRLGASIKGVFSSIAGYRSSAVMVDVGGVFIHPDKNITIGMTIRNLGFALSRYTENVKSNLPFDVQVGGSIKPEHMPVRFSLTAFNLTSSRLVDTDDNQSSAVREVLSRFNIGAELLLHKNVNVLVGYNYFLHQALRLENGGGGAGVCYGVSVAVKSFEFLASRNAFVAGNAGYSFTLLSNLNSLLKRS